MPGPVVVSSAVEGIVDEAIVRTLITRAGGTPGPTYCKQGKAPLRTSINGYNNAARHAPWLVLMDLDRDADCAPHLCQELVPLPAPRLCFRIAVRQVEAWLIADAARLARYLSVAQHRVSNDPEGLQNAKTEMVNIARKSRSKTIRQTMVPRAGSGRSVGPAYASKLIEFAETKWRSEIAAQHSESLRRAIACLEHIIQMSAFPGLGSPSI